MSEKPTVEEMARALRVIYTWAAFDHEHYTDGTFHALDPVHVMRLCKTAMPPKESSNG